MLFWDKVTGKDIEQELATLEARVQALPLQYQQAWSTLRAALWQHSDFSGRNLIPFGKQIVDYLEELAAEQIDVNEALGGDVRTFCKELLQDEANTIEDRWKKKLNRKIARKLGK